MKKAIIVALILAASVGVQAQTSTVKQLPAKVIITLTDKEVLSIDSAISAAVANTDSKQLTNYIITRFRPLFLQIEAQMVADKPKEGVKP